MEPSQPQALYHCPLCGEMRALADTCLGMKSFEAYHIACHSRKPNVRNVEGWNTTWKDWACTACILSGRAIVATFRYQRSVDAFPPAMAVYRDEQRKCADCGQEYVFTAKEQLLWYEEWQIPIECEPKACTPCRMARKQAREVSLAVQALKRRAKAENSLQAMEALASFYKAHDKPGQADYWTRNARKARAEKLATLAKLLDQMNVNDKAAVRAVAALVAETGQSDTPIGRDIAKRLKNRDRKKPK